MGTFWATWVLFFCMVKIPETKSWPCRKTTRGDVLLGVCIPVLPDTSSKMAQRAVYSIRNTTLPRADATYAVSRCMRPPGRAPLRVSGPSSPAHPGRHPVMEVVGEAVHGGGKWPPSNRTLCRPFCIPSTTKMSSSKTVFQRRLQASLGRN